MGCVPWNIAAQADSVCGAWLTGQWSTVGPGSARTQPGSAGTRRAGTRAAAARTGPGHPRSLPIAHNTSTASKRRPMGMSARPLGRCHVARTASGVDDANASHYATVAPVSGLSSSGSEQVTDLNAARRAAGSVSRREASNRTRQNDPCARASPGTDTSTPWFEPLCPARSR